MPQSPTQIYLIRHGETAWTREKRFQGTTDIELSAYGKRQARCVASKILHSRIDFLYCSALKRAKQTARAIALKAGKRPRIDKRLNELAFGSWEGKTAEELRREKDPVFLNWCRGKYVSPTGGESLKHLRKRAELFFREIRRRHPHQKIAVVSHGGWIKMILFKALKLDHSSLWSIRIDPASISKVSVYPHLIQVESLNDCCHLKGKKAL